jgi:hypothetical protein
MEDWWLLRKPLSEKNIAANYFGLGDRSLGHKVTFWGNDWDKQNKLSGGPTPKDFLGFTNTPNAVPTCATQWSATTGPGPGNKVNPPKTVPSYMAVIVTSVVTKSKAAISGNTTEIAIVKTDPGYKGDPKHEGTGTVVDILPCT